MGNAWFGKMKRSNKRVLVHPVGGGEGVTIKVRITKGQLKDLMEKVEDMSRNHNSSELGRLILQECSKGRLHARVVAEDDGASQRSPNNNNNYASLRGWGLRPIQE